MAPRQIHSALPTLGMTAALLAAALGAGCLQQAPSPMPSSGAGVSPSQPPASIAPAQAEARPTAPPTAQPLPDALASPSVDSDLAPDDSAAIESLVDSDVLQAYLPSDLIHDGGVILYRTLSEPALADDKGGAKDALQKGKTAKADDKDEPPSDWKRSDGKREKGRALQLRKDDPVDQPITTTGANRRVKVTVKYAVSGSLQYTSAAGRPVSKAYRQLFDRSFKFKLDGDRWELAQVSTLHHESQGGHSGLDITSLAIFPEAGTTPIDSVSAGDKFDDVDKVAKVGPGDKVRVEVAAKKQDGGPVFVYAYLVGTTDRARVELVDDGTLGDATAGDGLYSGTFIVPQVTGLHHFAVDVLDPSSFSPGGLYRSVGLGLSVKVQAK